MTAIPSVAVTIESLIKSGAIKAHKDGNYGSNYPKVSEFGSLGIPFLTAKSLSGGKLEIDDAPRLAEETANKLPMGFILPGDVLLSHNATVGRVAVVPDFQGKLLIGTSLTYFRLDTSRIIPGYLAAFFSSVNFQNQLKAVMSHTTRNQVPITAQRNLSVVLPPVAVQKDIAAVLRAFDDRIALLRETNGTLEAILHATFKSWFVDFDPVRAKQEGRAPDGIDEVTAALFPDDFEESATGPVPKGWRNGTLGDLADLNPESWTSKTRPETIQYVDLANAKNNEIDEVTTFSFEEAPSRARRVLRLGDTVVGTVRPGNRSFAHIYEATSNLTGSTGFAVLRPRDQSDKEFLFIAATRDASIEHLAHVADGGAYPAVRPEVVSGLKTVLPNRDVLAAFHALAAPIFLGVGENRSRLRTLTAIRDVLLPRLISGQLRLQGVTDLMKHAA